MSLWQDWADFFRDEEVLGADKVRPRNNSGLADSLEVIIHGGLQFQERVSLKQLYPAVPPLLTRAGVNQVNSA